MKKKKKRRGKARTSRFCRRGYLGVTGREEEIRGRLWLLETLRVLSMHGKGPYHPLLRFKNSGSLGSKDVRAITLLGGTVGECNHTGA